MVILADDIAVLSERESELEEMLNGMNDILRSGYNRKINKSKSKVMLCSKNNEKLDNLNIKIGDGNNQ